MTTLTMVAGSPAQAAAFRVYIGDSYAGTDDGQRWVEVCDMEQDGNGVYAYFFVQGASSSPRVGDPNGSAGGCGNATFSGNVLAITVCEAAIGTDPCKRETHN